MGELVGGVSKFGSTVDEGIGGRMVIISSTATSDQSWQRRTTKCLPVWPLTSLVNWNVGYFDSKVLSPKVLYLYHGYIHSLGVDLHQGHQKLQRDIHQHRTTQSRTSRERAVLRTQIGQ
jgi:hypothetical protein